MNNNQCLLVTVLQSTVHSRHLVHRGEHVETEKLKVLLRSLQLRMLRVCLLSLILLSSIPTGRLAFFPLSRWRNRGSEKFSKLPKVPQQLAELELIPRGAGLQSITCKYCSHKPSARDSPALSIIHVNWQFPYLSPVSALRQGEGFISESSAHSYWVTCTHKQPSLDEVSDGLNS